MGYNNMELKRAILKCSPKYGNINIPLTVENIV